MTCGFRFPFNGGRLTQVKRTKKDKHGTAKGWPRPLNRGSHLIQGRYIWVPLYFFQKHDREVNLSI